MRPYAVLREQVLDDYLVLLEVLFSVVFKQTCDYAVKLLIRGGHTRHGLDRDEFLGLGLHFLWVRDRLTSIGSRRKHLVDLAHLLFVGMGVQGESERKSACRCGLQVPQACGQSLSRDLPLALVIELYSLEAQLLFECAIRMVSGCCGKLV